MAENGRARALYAAVGERIAAARAAKDPRWTQTDLANRTSGRISRSAIANMEVGRQRIALYQLYELATALEATPEDLLPLLADLPPLAEADVSELHDGDRAFVESIRTPAKPVLTRSE